MSEMVMDEASARAGCRGIQGLRRHGGRLALVVVLLCAVAGCAIPFGPGSESEPARTPQDRNRIYLEEQERIERDRRVFDAVHPSER